MRCHPSAVPGGAGVTATEGGRRAQPGGGDRLWLDGDGGAAGDDGPQATVETAAQRSGCAQCRATPRLTVVQTADLRVCVLCTLVETGFLRQRKAKGDMAGRTRACAIPGGRWAALGIRVRDVS